MGISESRPPECKGTKCTVCGQKLAPCKSFKDIVEEEVWREGAPIKVENFLQGRYYKIKSYEVHYSPECFWKPKTESYIVEKDINHEKQTHKQLSQASSKKEQARRSQAVALRDTKGKSLKSIQSKRYKSFKPLEPADPSHLQKRLQSSTVEESNEDSSNDEEEWEESVEITDDIVSSVSSLLKQMDPNGRLDIKWLRAAQTLLFTHYMQLSKCSSLDADRSLDSLAYIQIGLNKIECLSLAKALSSLQVIPLSKYSASHGANLPVVTKLFSLLFQCISSHPDNSLWMQNCFHVLVSSITEDRKLQKMVLETGLLSWSNKDRLALLQKCYSKQLSAVAQKQIINLIQTYDLSPSFISTTMDSNKDCNVVSEIRKIIDERPRKKLLDILQEIRNTKWVDAATLTKVEKVMFTVNDRANEWFQNPSSEMIANTQGVFERLASSSKAVSDKEIAQAIVTLVRAVHVHFLNHSKDVFPTQVQLVALLILLFSSQARENKLLEVFSGEGKSCIIAMLATALALQGKHVDIVTSSTVLAVRDATFWADFYKLFDLDADHNIDPESQAETDNIDIDEEKRELYEDNLIVYGTVNTFSADILHEEFEQKRIRSGCKYDAVIVDEVDMLMLDEGVQFTYLSHNAAVLHHMEPVLAAVWAIIGPQIPVVTEEGDILYASRPKFFTEIIFECLDPEISGINEPSRILAIANELKIISEEQLKKLAGTNQKDKAEVMCELTPKDALRLLSGLESYINVPKFEVHIVGQDGSLKVITTLCDSETTEKIWLQEKGAASSLTTRAVLHQRATEIIKHKLLYCDTNTGSKIIDALIKLLDDNQDEATQAS